MSKDPSSQLSPRVRVLSNQLGPLIPTMGPQDQYAAIEPNLPHRWLNLVATGAGPSGRYGHSAVVWNRNVYIFGGFNSESGTLNDVHKYSIDTKTWTAVPHEGTSVPAKRFYHSASVYNADMYIYGGFQVTPDSQQGTTYFSDVWRFNFESCAWTMIECTGDLPSGRHNHTTVIYDMEVATTDGQPPPKPAGAEVKPLEPENTPSGRPRVSSISLRNSTTQESLVAYMYLFGGYGRRVDTMYRLCLATRVWECVTATGTVGSLRAHTAVVYHGHMYLFGGRQDKLLVNDVYAYNFRTSVWQRLRTVGDVPSQRFGHTTVVHGCFLYTFGGLDKDGTSSDLYRLSLDDGRSGVHEWCRMQRRGHAPSGRYYHSAVIAEHDMYIFGGYSDDGFDKKRSFKDDLYRVWLDPIVVPASTLSADLNQSLNDKTFADVVFAVEEQRIFSHRVVLASRSAVFRHLILTHQAMEGAASPLVIPITDTSYVIFLSLLEFIYTDRVDFDLDPDTMMDMLAVAGKYKVPRLRMLCMDRLRQSVTVANVGPILLIAEEHSAWPLKDYCMDFIGENLDAVRAHSGFATLKKSPDLLFEVTEMVADRMARATASATPERERRGTEVARSDVLLPPL